MNLIDIHTHILPGLDDGARDLEQSLAMAEVAVQDGITMLVATPHVIRGSYDTPKDEILQHVRTLNQCLEDAGVKLPILPGAEYYLERDLPQRLQAGQLLTLNNGGRYLLVELPAAMVPDYVGQVLYAVQMQGVTPIIAHPERNRTLAKHPEILAAMVERGILAQVTSASLTGLFGRSVKETALKFLQAGSAQVLASDGHSAQGRAPVLSAAFQEIERRWGVGYARTLSCTNPDRIIRGLPVETSPPPKPERPWTKYFKKTF